MKWNTSENRWEFFSWCGTRGADGCEIHINVYNGAGSVPANFNTNAAKEALINARDIWTQAIREAGITCESVTKFESEGQTLFTSLPRIDVYFVRQIKSGSARGATTVTFHRSTRQFSRVEISIATEYVSNAYYKPQGSHGNFEIYVMKPNGSLQTHLTNNPAYDADTDWATMRIK